MATLEKIRNKAGLLVVVIGLALFAFIIGDFLTSSQSFFAMKESNIITVNDEKINIDEFQRYADKLHNTGNVAEERLYEVAYDRIVDEYVLNQELAKVGITVSDEELRDLLVGDNIHSLIIQQYSDPQTGFNKEWYLDFVNLIFNPEENGITDPNQLAQIEMYRMQWLNIEDVIRQIRGNEKLMTLLNIATAPNKLDAEMTFAESANSANIQFVKLPYTSVADADIEVTQDDINGRFNAYNSNYPVDESREVNYIQVDIRPSAEDYAAVEAEIKGYYEEFATTDDVKGCINAHADHEYVGVYTAIENLDPSVREFVEGAKVGDATEPISLDDQYVMYRLEGVKTAPDTVKANVILFAYGDTTLNTVYADLKAGIELDTVVNKYALPMMKELPVVEDQLIITDGQYQFNLGVNFINDVYSADNNYFTTSMLDGTQCIVKVVDRIGNVKKANVATFAMDVITSDQTIHDTEAKLHEYATTNSNLEDFIANAAAAGYIMKRDMCSLNKSTIGNVANSREVVKWAYNSSKGAVSNVFNISDKYLVVAAVNKVNPRGAATLDASTENYIRMQLRNEKKADVIKERINGTTYTTLDELATAMGVTVENRNNVAVGDRMTAPAVAGAVANLEVGAMSAPIAAADGVYVVQVVAKNEPAVPYDESTQMVGITRPVDANMVMQSLRNNAEIETTYTKFF